MAYFLFGHLAQCLPGASDFITMLATPLAAGCDQRAVRRGRYHDWPGCCQAGFRCPAPI